MVSQTLRKFEWGIGLIVLCSITGPLSTAANDLTAHQLTAPPGEKRVIEFKTAKSLGTISLGESDSHCSVGDLKQVGPALGRLTLFVPKNLRLFYEPNALVIRQPNLMSGITPHGIDILILKAMEIDEEEKGNCDRVVEYAGEHFKELRELVVDVADVTDDGLAHLKDMPSLEAISTMSCHDIKGKCFASLSKLPNLQRLNLRGHQLDSESLKYLALFPKLTFLGLRSTSINEAGLKAVARCSHLTDLVLSENFTITDNCLAALSPMKHLRKLDLGSTPVTDRGMEHLLGLPALKSLSLNNTRVTPRGLAVLLPLKLEALKLSDQYRKFDLTKIGPIASKITYGLPSGHVDPDTSKEFAPLH